MPFPSVFLVVQFSILLSTARLCLIFSLYHYGCPLAALFVVCTRESISHTGALSGLASHRGPWQSTNARVTRGSCVIRLQDQGTSCTHASTAAPAQLLSIRLCSAVAYALWRSLCHRVREQRDVLAARPGCDAKTGVSIKGPHYRQVSLES